MTKSLNYLRKSKIANFQSIMSDEEVLQALLNKADEGVNLNTGELELKNLNDEELKSHALNAIADVLQSITSEGLFIHEIIEKIYTDYEDLSTNNTDNSAGLKLIQILGNMFKVVHGNYNEYKKGVKGDNEELIFHSETPFAIPFELPVTKSYKYKIKVKNKSGDEVDKVKTRKLYKHNSQYGVLNEKIVSLATEKLKSLKKSDNDVKDLLVNFDNKKNPIDFALKSIAIKKAFEELPPDLIEDYDVAFDNKNNVLVHCVEQIVNSKIKKSKSKKSNDADTIFVNKRSNDQKIICDKDNPSLAFMLIDSPNLRIGTRNSIELATFFNLLSTIELSKCQPFFNATFILPGIVKNNSNRVYKTASVTQFLDGTPLNEDLVNNNYKTLEASFTRSLSTTKGKINQEAVTTNMSAFTMPQTVNSFDEFHVGHNESMPEFTGKNFSRPTTIHDYTRPFLTIKSFDIDVAPTQGLMSFKTGKLSIVLHDKTRMSDIAPFIKPDMFGSFGAEIAIEYGWSHMDAENNLDDQTNFIGEFLDKSRAIEKYIITNASFTMDKNGQINIDLSIAMRGPLDIRTALLVSDPPAKASKDKFFKAVNDFKNQIAQIRKKFSIEENFTSALSNEINSVGTDANALKKADLSFCEDFISAIKQNKKQSVSYQVGDIQNGSTVYSNKLKKINILDGIVKERKKNFKDLLTFVKLKSNSPDEVSVNIESIFKKLLKLKKKGETINIASDLPVNIVSKTDSIVSDDLNELVDALSYFINIYTAVNAILQVKASAISKQKALIKKIVHSYNISDPFYNKEWLKQYHRIVLNKDIELGINVIGLGESWKGGSAYITFGAFVTGLIGTHLVNTGKFDEIQVLSYTTNENCGLMSNLNISSFLLPRKKLEEFLDGLFERGTSMTVESILTQVITRFISTRNQICYGLSQFYTEDSAGNTKIVKSISSDKEKRNRLDVSGIKSATKQLSNADFRNQIQKRLGKIYHCLADEKLNARTYFTSNKNNILTEVEFLMPKIKLTFDTLTSKKDNMQRTICRISIFDENDNPFGSIHSIMKKVYDEGAITIAAKLNRLRASYNAKGTDKKNVNKNSLKMSKKEFYKKQGDLIDTLIRQKILVEQNDGTFIIKSKGFVGDTVKNAIKRIMPSITYGTQNSAVIDASVTTVNEAKLNTVYLTRSDRNSESSDVARRVFFEKDLPLRVLPSQSNITVFGCPFANFAQYIFLDFETGTTIDNAYAITGIKHSLTPGKFTTSLTLSYGDVYGKYESTASTLSRELSSRSDNSSGASDNNSLKTYYIKAFSKTKNIKAFKSATTIDKKVNTQKNISLLKKSNNTENDLEESTLFLYKKFNLDISTYTSRFNRINIDAININKEIVDVQIRHEYTSASVDFDDNTKKISTEINLLDNNKIKKDFNKFLNKEIFVKEDDIVKNYNQDVINRFKKELNELFSIKKSNINLFNFSQITENENILFDLYLLVKEFKMFIINTYSNYSKITLTYEISNKKDGRGKIIKDPELTHDFKIQDDDIDDFSKFFVENYLNTEFLKSNIKPNKRLSSRFKNKKSKNNKIKDIVVDSENNLLKINYEVTEFYETSKNVHIDWEEATDFVDDPGANDETTPVKDESSNEANLSKEAIHKQNSDRLDRLLAESRKNPTGVLIDISASAIPNQQTAPQASASPDGADGRPTIVSVAANKYIKRNFTKEISFSEIGKIFSELVIVFKN